MYRETIQAAGDDRDIKLLMLLPNSDLEINEFQRRSTVVIQKSIKEGFGLTVSEALWNKKAVIGDNIGDIPLQIIHDVNGCLVNTPEEAVHYALYLIRQEEVGKSWKITCKEKLPYN